MVYFVCKIFCLWWRKAIGTPIAVGVLIFRLCGRLRAPDSARGILQSLPGRGAFCAVLLFPLPAAAALPVVQVRLAVGACPVFCHLTFLLFSVTIKLLDYVSAYRPSGQYVSALFLPPSKSLRRLLVMPVPSVLVPDADNVRIAFMQPRTYYFSMRPTFEGFPVLFGILVRPLFQRFHS